MSFSCSQLSAPFGSAVFQRRHASDPFEHQTHALRVRKSTSHRYLMEFDLFGSEKQVLHLLDPLAAEIIVQSTPEQAAESQFQLSSRNRRSLYDLIDPERRTQMIVDEVQGGSQIRIFHRDRISRLSGHNAGRRNDYFGWRRQATHKTIQHHSGFIPLKPRVPGNAARCRPAELAKCGVVFHPRDQVQNCRHGPNTSFFE